MEKYIQEKLDIPMQFRDECPGIPMTRKRIGDEPGPFHGMGADEGGLAATLRTNGNIPTSMASASLVEKQTIVDKLQEIYEGNDDWGNIWPVARDWLKKMKADGHLDSGLNIPN